MERGKSFPQQNLGHLFVRALAFSKNGERNLTA
jgi:hypothetical protein